MRIIHRNALKIDFSFKKQADFARFFGRYISR